MGAATSHSFTINAPVQGDSSLRQVCDCGAVFVKREDATDESSERLMSEAFILTNLRKEIDPSGEPFIPELVNVGLNDDAEWTNSFMNLDGFYTLEQVSAEHGALDPRDAAWMFRRLLAALGHAHVAGVVHGAPLPPHVLIHPEQHGLVLVDWSHAFVPDVIEYNPESVRMAKGYESWYPAEAVDGKPGRVGRRTDIYLAAQTMVWLMGGDPALLMFNVDTDRKTRAFFSALLGPPERRPNYAFDVLGLYTDLIEKLYGARRFRPFSMP